MAYLDCAGFEIFGDLIIVLRHPVEHIEQIRLVNSGGNAPHMPCSLTIIRGRVHNIIGFHDSKADTTEEIAAQIADQSPSDNAIDAISAALGLTRGAISPLDRS